MRMWVNCKSQLRLLQDPESAGEARRLIRVDKDAAVNTDEHSDDSGTSTPPVSARSWPPLRNGVALFAWVSTSGGHIIAFNSPLCPCFVGAVPLDSIHTYIQPTHNQPTHNQPTHNTPLNTQGTPLPVVSMCLLRTVKVPRSLPLRSWWTAMPDGAR